MVDIGYTLSSELYGPTELAEQAARAEAVGFDFLAVSDHFHPWLPQQGESPFVWTTLGSVARETDDVDVGTFVTCPSVRIHPANVAHAAATAAAALDGRFFLGVGTGERLNEHVTGEHWPSHDVRLEMLEEAVEVIDGLWSGEGYTHHGTHYTVENAKLYTRPDERPPVVVSAYGPRTARAAAGFGDGFATVGPQGELLETYRDAGGEGAAYAQLTACYEADEDAAVETAHERWPVSALPGELNSELATPEHFEQASQLVTREDVAESSIVTDPDPETHVENLRQFEEAGFDRVTVYDAGTDPDGFLELYEQEVLPAVR